MGLIGYKGVLYGGGSDVEANPQDSATDTLTKVGINGTVYEVTDADAVHTSDIGTANGVAELDSNGLVPSSQLPSYVDDVLEYASVSAFPATGETGKIYVALDTNLTYRWSGSAYVEISPSLALGETSSTAYRGDRGKTAYDHATESGRSGAKSAGLYKIGVTAQGHVASATAVAKADLTALGVADQNDVDAIEEDIEGFKTVTGEYITINDAASLPADSYSLTLSPVQDLNGYEYPWAAGAGKNKVNPTLPVTITSQTTIAEYSTSKQGIWTGTVRATNNANLRGALNLYFKNGSTVVRQIQSVIEIGATNELVSVTSDASDITFNNVSIAINGGQAGYSITVTEAQINEGAPLDKVYPYSNICPIHGADEVGVRVCGKNLLKNINPGGGVVTINADKSVTVNGTVQSTAWLLLGTITLEPGTYILSGTPSNAPTLSYVYDASTFSPNNWISPAGGEATITLTEKKTGNIYIRLNGNGTVFNNVTFKPMVRPASVTDSTYEQYTATDTTITLPSTVYGGSVEQGGSGQVTLGEYTFTGNETYESYSYGRVYVSNSAFSAFKNPVSRDIPANLICEGFKCVRDDHIEQNGGQISFYGNRVGFCLTKQTANGDIDALKAVITGMKIVVELATPTDISVTPFPQTLLDGVNNVWAEMVENSTVIDNAQQSLSYQPQNIVGQLRQEIEAKPDSFAELSDTSFSNLSNGQIPKWNSTSGKWENANESGGGGASSLAELSDTNISSPADGQILKWDGTSSKWVNAAEYSYTLPTASASTKGGIKVGDNLAMNGEVLSAKLPQWTKIWNYNSGATFSMPSGKTDIMLVIMVSLLVDNRAMSNVYPVEYPFSASLVCSYELDSALGGGTLAITVSTANTVTITNTSQFTSQVDFEIWVR